MYTAHTIAAYIYNKYQQNFADIIPEMKLHKLLYYVQRESYIQIGKPLFVEPFYAYKFGPVMPSIRNNYKNKTFAAVNISPEVERIVENVFARYGTARPWTLAMMSHEEISWQNARIDVPPSENGMHIMLNNDIKKDANRIKQIRSHAVGQQTDLISTQS